MRKKRLFWNIYPIILAIVLFSLASVTTLSMRYLWQVYLEQTEQQLLANARLMQTSIAPIFSDPNLQSRQKSCKSLSEQSSSRISLIKQSGEVICDAWQSPNKMDNHNDRPEIIQALEQGNGVSTRYSRTIKKTMIYVALKIDSPLEEPIVLRLSIPITTLKTVFRDSRNKIFLLGIAVILFVAAVTWYFSRRISYPLEVMKKGAENFAKGRFNHHLPIIGSEEISSLAVTMNQMAGDLSTKLETIQHQQSQLDAVFTSMQEGVFAVNSESRLFALNPSAAEILGIQLETAMDKNILEVVRNTKLNALLTKILESSDTLGEIFSIESGDKTRTIQIHGKMLKYETGKKLGALVVMNDITELKRLENIRRDFVANVSHELKTPITSIKGAVETLETGAMAHPEDAKRFLEMIHKNSDRLNRIIEDLLSLSRIEQSNDIQSIPFEMGSLQSIIQESIQSCEMKAADKSIRIITTTSGDIQLPINAPLLEEAIVNLLDNAIKYSGTGTQVSISVEQTETMVELHVKDSGNGIPEEHLPRLFERFYRVDKARSRNLGGTGLGLAIVKHIVQIHGGRINVSSKIGEGSIFTLHLPLFDRKVKT